MLMIGAVFPPLSFDDGCGVEESLVKYIGGALGAKGEGKNGPWVGWYRKV